MQIPTRTKGVHRRRAPRAVLLEDDLLRARLYAAARGRQRKQLEFEFRRHRPDVARRLHHSQPFLGKIKDAFDKNPELNNLLVDDFFSGVLNDYQACVAARGHQSD